MRSEGHLPSTLALLGALLALLSTSCHSLTPDAEPPQTGAEIEAGPSAIELARSIVAARARRLAQAEREDLLDALALLPPGLHWRFVHVGAGPLEAELRRQADRLGLAFRSWRSGPS